MTDETSLSQSGTIGPRSVSVTGMVARDFNDRAARGARSQFRFIVGYDKLPDGGTAADGGTDEVDFATGESLVGEPTLDVTYEYP